MNIDKQTINEQVYGHKHLDSRQRTLYCAVRLWSVVMGQASNMALRKCFKAAVHIPHTRETSVNGNIIDWILLNIYHVSIYLYTTRRRYYSS